MIGLFVDSLFVICVIGNVNPDSYRDVVRVRNIFFII